MAANPTISIVLSAQDNASRTLSALRQNGARTASAISSGFRGVTGVMGSFVSAIGSAQTALTTLAAAYGATAFASKAMREYQDTENALIGLSSVADKVGADAGKFGKNIVINAEVAKEAAKDLAADGLMTVADAAISLKNLLLSGFGVSEAVEMMVAFKDSAAFGRQSALGFGEAIRGATEGIKNQDSVLVDNAGITKNLSIMHKEYAASIGKTIGELTDLEKRHAEYLGILNEAKPMLGDAKRMTDTYSGAVAGLSSSFSTMMAEIGERLAPVLKSLIDSHIKPLIESTTQWIRENEKLIDQRLSEWVANAVEWVKTLFTWIQSGNGQGWFSGLTNSLNSVMAAFQSMSQWWSANSWWMLDLLKYGGAFAAGSLVAGPTGGLVAMGGVAAYDAYQQVTGGNEQQSAPRMQSDQVSRRQAVVYQDATFSGLPQAEMRTR